jgi:signal transduction histidine kinase
MTTSTTLAWDIRTVDPERARRLAEQALAVGDGSESAHALVTIAYLDQRVSRSSEAEERALRALEIFRLEDDPLGESRALNILGNIASGRGDFSGAREHFEQSLAIAERIDNADGIATILNNLGYLAFNQGDFTTALEHHLRALRIREEIGSQEGIAMSLHNLGNVHLVTGETSRALEFYLRSLAIRQQIGDRHGEAGTLNNIGSIYTDLGELPEGLDYQLRGLAIREEIDDRGGMASSLHNISNIYYGLDQYPLALEYALRALAITRQTGDRFAEARSLQNIGSIHYCLGDPDAAQKHYTEALEIQIEIGDRQGEGATYAKRGGLRLDTGNLADAGSDLVRSREIFEEIGDRGGLAESLLRLGQIAGAQQRWEEAIAAMEQALAIATEIERRSMQGEIHSTLADTFERAGDFRSAVEHLRIARALEKELYGNESRERIRNLKVAAEIAASQREAELARSNAEIERLRNVELRRALDDLKSAQSSLVQSEKMASLGQLTAGVAHEINNPINFVSASVKPLRRDFAWLHEAAVKFRELARDNGADEEDIEELEEEHDLDFLLEESNLLFDGIEKGASRTAAIVAGLRNFARLEESDRKSVDIHEGIESALTLLSVSLHEGIEIRREYGELPAVECYPGEINQAVMNILANAIQAIEGAGTITIATEAVNESVTIRIGDTGCGMSAEVEAHIFEPFFTTRDVGQGRGLGLSIAWGIVEKHGGTIEVESAPGVGSVFVVTLPAGQRTRINAD